MDDRRRAMIVASAVALAIGVGILALFGGGAGSLRASGASVAMIIAIVVGVVLVVLVAKAPGWARRSKAEKRRERDMAAESVGLLPLPRDRTELHKEFQFLKEVPKSGDVIDAYAGEVDGQRFRLVCHRYVVSTGQTMVEVAHTICAAAAPNWPSVRIAPRGFGSRLGRRLGLRRGMELDDPDFNTAFKVTTDDEAFAATLLTPEMQRYLLDKPTVRWTVGHGKVCLIYRGRLRVDRAQATLERMAGFWKHVEPVLLEWSSPVAGAPD